MFLLSMCTLCILCALTILLCHRGLQVKELFYNRLSFPWDWFVPMNLLWYLIAGVRWLKRRSTKKEIPGQLHSYNLDSPSLTGHPSWDHELYKGLRSGCPLLVCCLLPKVFLKGQLHTLLGRFQRAFVLVVTIMWLWFIYHDLWPVPSSY